MRIIGRVIRYRGKKVKVVGWAGNKYWVKVVEPVAGYEQGEQLTMSKRIVEERCK